MKTKGMLILAVVVALAIFSSLGAPTAQAQAVYGSILGTVTDPQGAAVAGAKVTVTSVNKGTVVDTTSNADGNYTVLHLIPDVYNIRVEASGFKGFEAKDVRVFADQSIRIEAQLTVGGATETVTVEAGDVPLVKTDRADVATTFTERQVTELPMLNRNFTDFQLLTPGTQSLTWQHASSENPQSSTQINVNGQHFSGTSFQLDGTDNRDPILGIIVVNPNLEGVTETKISTQNYDAEFGQALAAVITAQTKSGSNDYHGSAFWFRRSDELQARDPFRNFAPDAVTGKFLPDALWNQFGGSVGGPIIKNKLFFFGDYQGTRQKVGQSALITVPTTTIGSTCLDPNSLICDFTDYTGAGSGIFLFDPATGNPDGTGRQLFNDPNCAAAGFAPGTCIDTSRLSPQALALLNLIPGPNIPGQSNSISNNYSATGTGGFDSNGFDTRIDYNATDKLHVLGRYSYVSYLLSGNGVFDQANIAVGGRGLGLNGFAGSSESRDQSLATGFDYTLSNTWLTDFRFGYFRYRVNVLPNGFGTQPMNSLTTPGGQNVQAPGLNLDDNFTSSMPAFFILDREDSRRVDFGYGLSDRLNRCNCPLQQQEDQFQFVNNWTHIMGNHQIKFGADIRYARNLRVPSDAHRSGELTFNQNVTSDQGNGGVGLASFLLGDVNQLSRYVSSAIDAGERQKRWFFYGQDTFRVTPKLTVNFGLRWEIYFPQTVTGAGKGGFVDINTGLVRVAGVGPIDDAMNVENSFTNFAPRLGFAYQATPKTVVRMGYGRSFDIGVFGSIFGHSVTQNLPVLTRQQVQDANSFLPAFTLDVGPPAFVFPTVDPDTGTFPLAAGNNQFVQTNKMVLPTVDAWNVTVQRQITSSMSFEIGYVGNKGTHVFAGNGPDYNCNQASVVGFPGTPQAQRRPFFAPFGWDQDMRCHLNNADNNYHALQTKVEKRFSKGYSFLAHYTWSKALNHDGDYYAIDPSVNYAPNDFNRNHVFVLTNLWELPIGRGKWIGGNASSLVDKFIGGWQINAVANWSGGLPFSPSYGECGSDRDTGPCRPDRVGSFEMSAGDLDPINHFVQYFTPIAPLANNGDSSGAWRRPQSGQFGTAGRNSLRGPGFFNTDFSIFKSITFTERVKGQFQFQAFNLFNNVNLGTPGVFFSAFGGGGGNCIDCSGSGRITSLGGSMRQLQFAAKVRF